MPVGIVAAVWVGIAVPLAVLVGRVIKRRGAAEAADEQRTNDSVDAGERP